MALDHAAFEAAVAAALQPVADQFQVKADIKVSASPIASDEDDFEVNVTATPVTPA